MRLQKGTLHLFRLFGIDVSVHWMWAVVAVLEVMWFSHGRGGEPLLLAAAVYLSLFGIVLLHEFGHALACKSVGGTARRIVLWPLGGVAFVQPPPRPGAVLWSIAAGPLVNVLLVPVTFWFAYATGGTFQVIGNPMLLAALPFVAQYALLLFAVNLALLLFNLLPIYPLDGGQILQALLWFVMGRSMALMVAASIGVAGGAAMALAGVFVDWWLVILGGFAVVYSMQALSVGRALFVVESAPRRVEPPGGAPSPVCPSCHAAPPVGEFWLCDCRRAFDMFEALGHCPYCGRIHEVALCPRCQTATPVSAWYRPEGAAGAPGSNGASVPSPVRVPPVMRAPPVLPRDAANPWKM